jgi:hypothetical protein
MNLTVWDEEQRKLHFPLFVFRSGVWFLNGPADGIGFDVRVNRFWMEDWGSRPHEADHAVTLALEHVARAPRLVPMFGHRYLASEPLLEGNPVFSVVQTDVVYYGNDLAGYFALEFGVAKPTWARSSPRKIDFWSLLAETKT